jgi:hypothetical protein
MTEEEFYTSIPTWIEADIGRWTHITLMAYFCHKYEKVNDVRFRLVRSRRGPTVGKEARDFAELFRTLAPESYKRLSPEAKKIVKEEVNRKIYNFINWMFDYKFRRGNKSVTGTRIFLIPSMINEFERMYSKFLEKHQTENKLSKLLVWCNKEAKDIFKSHQLERAEDLKMIHRYVEMYSLGVESPEVRVLGKAKDLGLL